MRKTLYIIPLLLAFAFTGNPPGWYQQTLPVNDFVNDIFFIDTLTGWVVTQGHTNKQDTAYIMKTTNGGDNWTVQYSRNMNMTTVQFTDQLTGYVGGESGTGTVYMLKTTDGGSSWIEIVNSIGGTVVDDMQFLNADTGWYCDGGLLKTTNGGINWFSQGVSAYRLHFINADTGWVGTDDRELFKTTNGGNNWILQTTFSNLLVSFTFANIDTGWALFQTSPMLRKTTNGGATWFIQNLPQSSNIFYYIKDIQAITAQKLWIAGGAYFFGSGIFRGLLFKTTDGGSNWGYELPDTSYGIIQFEKLFFLRDSIGWAYSSSKGIHTVTDGDSVIYTHINITSTEVPENFKLLQNYPNPFNPTTNIKFSIKTSSLINLSIFDISGKQIETVVNENLSPGEYSYSFKANKLSSGIFLYRLTANGIIIDTKKMILMK